MLGKFDHVKSPEYLYDICPFASLDSTTDFSPHLPLNLELKKNCTEGKSLPPETHKHQKQANLLAGQPYFRSRAGQQTKQGAIQTQSRPSTVQPQQLRHTTTGSPHDHRSHVYENNALTAVPFPIPTRTAEKQIKPDYYSA
jgi:hypothetical protein